MSDPISASQIQSLTRILDDYDYLLLKQNQELEEQRAEIQRLQHLLHESNWVNMHNKDLAHQLDLRDLAIRQLEAELTVKDRKIANLVRGLRVRKLRGNVA